MFVATLLIGMSTLAIWAITNIFLWAKYKNSGQKTTQYFWEMNALWNVINFIIAFSSIVLIVIRYSAYSTDGALQDMQIKIVAVNIVLDIFYILAGFLLEKQGKKIKNDRFIGYGSAIQLQGAFLFFFDSFLTLLLIVSTL